MSDEVNEVDLDVMLKQMDQDWDEKIKAGPNDVPEGEYEAMMEKGDFGLSETSGKPRIMREFVILEGKYKGKKVRDYMSLNSQYGPYFVKLWAQSLGAATPRPTKEGFNSLIETAKKTAVNIKVKRSGDEGQFTNITTKAIA